MRKKKSGAAWIIIILLIIALIMMGIIYFNQSSQADTVTSATSTTSKTTEVTVGTQTIIKTISSSGQISTNVTENLELNTYRYFKEVYVEENDYVAEGENILKYTNGTYLQAPYNCVVTKLSIPSESGDRCTSQHYITVQSADSLLMTLNIDETEIGKVAVGQEVEIVANAYSDKTYTGTISKINQIGTYASNGSSFTATVVFENDGDIKIGMSAQATITIEKSENVVAIPIEAVQTQGGSKYVVVKNSDGTTSNVTIETGLSNDAYVEVTSGLKGEEIIEMTTQTSSSSTSNKGGMMGGMKQEGMMQRENGSGFSGMQGGAPGGSKPSM